MTSLFIFIVLFFAMAEEPSVRILENPSVSAEREIYLKDIAMLNNLSEQDLEQIGNIKIAESYEQLKKMSSRDIMKKIKPQLRAFESHCECKLQLTIPHALVIRSLPGNFAVEKVKTLMEAELKKSCSHCQFELSELNIIRGNVPAAYTRWNLDLRQTEWRGPSMVRVYFDDDAFSPLVLQTLVKIKKPVLKLKEAIGMGQQLSVENCEEHLMDVTYESLKYAQSEDLHGMEVKRSLAKGSVITMNDLVAHNMIRLGQPVSIEMQNDAFVIEMVGVALKNGKLGEKIPVRVNKTQKNISAEIISDAKVRM